jgi:flagellar biosynthesis protein FlhG
MTDQAARLREIATELQTQQNAGLLSRNALQRKRVRARVYAVASGKGGVGKSHIALNVALKLKEDGFLTLLADADINLANADILMGYVPKATLADAVVKNYPIRDVIYTGPDDIHVLPGGSGFSELIALPESKQSQMLDQLEELEFNYDYIIIDIPAGIHKQVLDFISCASSVLVITTPEPTAIADAYALIKVLTLQKTSVHFNIIINQVKSEKQAEDIVMKFKLVIGKFLKIPVQYAGYVLTDKHIMDATIKQQPFVLLYPKSPAAQCIKKISEQIISQRNILRETNYHRIGERNPESFFRRMAKFSLIH